MKRHAWDKPEQPRPSGGHAPLTPEDVARIEERCEKAMPGRWFWNVNLKHRSMSLESTGNGSMRETVMDFVRWGMGGARARFQRPNGVMKNADEMTVEVEGRRHHAAWFQALAHPDADFIAASRADVPTLCRALREAWRYIDTEDMEATALAARVTALEAALADKDRLLVALEETAQRAEAEVKALRELVEKLDRGRVECLWCKRVRIFKPEASPHAADCPAATLMGWERSEG